MTILHVPYSLDSGLGSPLVVHFDENQERQRAMRLTNCEKEVVTPTVLRTVGRSHGTPQGSSNKTRPGPFGETVDHQSGLFQVRNAHKMDPNGSKLDPE